jgi:flagellin
MPVINTNVSAVIAKNALVTNEREMDTAMERLSTGKRINSAGDDAAGMAISSRMSSQIAGLEQAARNANDGISMIQTAESAYVEVSEMLQRMRMLSIQAASETYSTADRAALNLEFQQLQDEVVRIADNTEWNGFLMLNGTIGDGNPVRIHSGSNADQTVDVSFGTLANTISFDPTRSVHTVGTGGNTETETFDLSFQNLEEDDIVTFNFTNKDSIATRGEFTITGVTTDAAGAVTGITVSALTFQDSATNTTVTGGAAFTIDVATVDKLTFEAGAADEAFDVSEIRVSRGGGLTESLSLTSLTSTAHANDALTKLDTVVNSINEQRATYGSYISRLEHAADNLLNVAVNQRASRSRILDADYAAETTELARTQIIQQAGTAMLAQANQIKQAVLELLK